MGCIINKVKRPFCVHLVFLRYPYIKIDPNTIVRSFDNTIQDPGVKRKQPDIKQSFVPGLEIYQKADYLKTAQSTQHVIHSYLHSHNLRGITE